MRPHTTKISLVVLIKRGPYRISGRSFHWGRPVSCHRWLWPEHVPAVKI